MGEDFDSIINTWKVGKVTSMSNMFGSGDEAYKGKFNQLIVDWDVSEVTDMKYMLKDAESFNQCLSTWGMKTSDDVDTKEMLEGTACPDCTEAACFSPIGVGPWCQKGDVCSTDPQAPSSPPSDSSPDDDCKGDDDEIKLKEEGKKKCKKISDKGLCDAKVAGGGRAKDFCTSCGECGEDPVPTPSPPDDDCKGDDDEIKLKEEGKKKCKKISDKGL